MNNQWIGDTIVIGVALVIGILATLSTTSETRGQGRRITKIGETVGFTNLFRLFRETHHQASHDLLFIRILAHLNEARDFVEYRQFSEHVNRTGSDYEKRLVVSEWNHAWEVLLEKRADGSFMTPETQVEHCRSAHRDNLRMQEVLRDAIECADTYARVLRAAEIARSFSHTDLFLQALRRACELATSPQEVQILVETNPGLLDHNAYYLRWAQLAENLDDLVELLPQLRPGDGAWEIVVEKLAAIPKEIDNPVMVTG